MTREEEDDRWILYNSYSLEGESEEVFWKRWKKERRRQEKQARLEFAADESWRQKWEWGDLKKGVSK